MGVPGWQIGLGVLSFAGMEAFAWLTHRYLMHGPLWVWHRSHHAPRTGVFEANDLFAVVFAAPAVLAFVLAHRWPWLRPVGVGVTAYGAVYALFHDGIVHQRFPVPAIWRRWLRGPLQSHRLHHAVHTREGCVSFGFLWARPVRSLKAQLAAKRAAAAEAPAHAVGEAP